MSVQQYTPSCTMLIDSSYATPHIIPFMHSFMYYHYIQYNFIQYWPTRSCTVLSVPCSSSPHDSASCTHSMKSMSAGSRVMRPGAAMYKLHYAAQRFTTSLRTLAHHLRFRCIKLVTTDNVPILSPLLH